MGREVCSVVQNQESKSTNWVMTDLELTLRPDLQFRTKSLFLQVGLLVLLLRIVPRELFHPNQDRHASGPTGARSLACTSRAGRAEHGTDCRITELICGCRAPGPSSAL